MNRTTMSLLAVAVVGLVVGLILTTGSFHLKHGAAALYVVLPVAAIFFGLFLMFRVFESESEAFDREAAQSRQRKPAKR